MKRIVRSRPIGIIVSISAVLLFVPYVPAGSHKYYVDKYSDVVMPVSLAVGTVRTPEFPVISKWYSILVQVEKPLPFMQMVCMMGVTPSPLDLKYCGSNDPLLRADWTVWEGEHVVARGSIPDRCACKFEEKYIYQLLG